MEQFQTEDDFYSVMFHELGHWTKTKERTNRIKEKLSHAQEELVAELTSAFLSREHGLKGAFQHTEYIAGWIDDLKDQPQEFFRAVSLANKSAKYIKGETIASQETATETVTK